MLDFRFVRGHGHRLWWTVGALAGLGALVWASAFVLGDPTQRSARIRVGAAANTGADRPAPVPPHPVRFAALDSLDETDYGTYVELQATPESAVRGQAVWVRAEDGRRLLVRVEPPAADSARAAAVLARGGRWRGYLRPIARAEFELWMDSLGVVLPRPPAGVKMGELPDSNFLKVDRRIVKNVYLSIRPEDLFAWANR
jgi:hypothetical protein